jgi:hypothetical protein
MTPNPDTAVREFDHRENGGIAVRLLWNSHTNCVSVAVEDKRAGESFQLTIDSADALDAFQHPYAYTDHPQLNSERGCAHQPERRTK